MFDKTLFVGGSSRQLIWIHLCCTWYVVMMCDSWPEYSTSWVYLGLLQFQFYLDIWYFPSMAICICELGNFPNNWVNSEYIKAIGHLKLYHIRRLCQCDTCWHNMSTCANVGNVNSLLIDSASPKTFFKERQEAFSFKMSVKQMSMK